MSEFESRSRDLILVPNSPAQKVESPAVKRQKTVGGFNSRQHSAGYNSGADSGDDLFDEILTTPQATKFSTQPTQILDRTAALSSPGNITSPEVRIPASSPSRPQPELDPKPRPTIPRVGRLASIMAPAGTSYQAPYPVTAPRPAKGQLVIELSDDDGPQYIGDSSDEDSFSRAGIKPTSFLPKSGKTSFGRSDVNNIDMREQASTAQARFNEIIAKTKFDPGRTSSAISLAEGTSDFKSKSPESIISQTFHLGTKRAADSMSTGYGSRNKPQSQTRPDRAMPAEEDFAFDVAQEQEMRRKIYRLQQISPNAFTDLEARKAIIYCRGNIDDAADLLIGPEIEVISDDNGPGKIRGSESHVDPQMKRQLKAPIKSIQERYSSTQNSRKLVPNVDTPLKPRRRLQQGRRHPSSPAPVAESPRKEIKQVTIQSDYGSNDSGIGSESEDDTELEGRVLNFINNCKAEDLADLANIKVELAAEVIAQRPFKNLDAARKVSDNTTGTKSGKKSNRQPVGEKVVQNAVDMMSGYEAVDALVATCEQLGKPLAEEISKWGFDVFGSAKTGELEMVSLDDDNESQRDSGIGTPSSRAGSMHGETGDDDIKAPIQPRHGRQVNFLKKPGIMNKDITLKDYQLVGLNWLALLYKHKLSCILADDMGLGKTCQVIAFLSHLAETDVSGPHLVIVPPSTLENWLREFQQFCPNLVVEPYYGSQKERAEAADKILHQRENINVVISTYEFAAKPDDNRFMRRLRPEVCVYDEGHTLKNPKSQRYEKLIRIPAQFRLLLTGTPLQNNLLELAALLGFILPEIFRERQEQLDFIFKHKASTRDSDHAALLSSQRIARAKSMLTPFVLRRKKDQVLKHMPTKTCLVEYCGLHPSQAVVYEGLREKARERAQLRLQGTKIPNDRENNPLMQLRKAAIHPMLFRRHFTDEKVNKMLEILKKREPFEFPAANHKHLLEEMMNLSDWYLHIWCQLHPCISRFDVPDLTWMNSGKVAVLVRLLESYKANGDRVLIFSQFTLVLDILEAILETSRIQFTRIDGGTKVNERQTIIDDFRDDKTTTAFLLSTGAGGTGLNLMFANKVIIFDSSFNPQDDIQAENRAHRVGQTKDVEVVRLVTRDTIEEQIYALGQSKLALDSKVAGSESVETKGEELVAKLLLEEESSPTKAQTVKAAETKFGLNGVQDGIDTTTKDGKKPSRTRRAK